MDNFWTWLGRIADSLGTLSVMATLVFSGLTYFMVKRERKKYLDSVKQDTPSSDKFEEILEINRGINSEKPVALVIALTPNNDTIAPNVERFMKTQNWKMPIREVKMNGINTVEDQKRFLNALLAKKREITAEGFTEVHLFINAPLFACVLTGSILKHWLPTKIYHKPTPPPPQFYEYSMPLI
jgi:hypothetical protein